MIRRRRSQRGVGKGGSRRGGQRRGSQRGFGGKEVGLEDRVEGVGGKD